MNKEHKHWCGCITEKIKGVIKFNKMCERHKKNKKYPWIALQHADSKENQND